MTNKNHRDSRYSEKQIEANNEIRHLLVEMSQKLDYVIELLRDEELRYPHHAKYLETARDSEQGDE